MMSVSVLILSTGTPYSVILRIFTGLPPSLTMVGRHQRGVLRGGRALELTRQVEHGLFQQPAFSMPVDAAAIAWCSSTSAVSSSSASSLVPARPAPPPAAGCPRATRSQRRTASAFWSNPTAGDAIAGAREIPVGHQDAGCLR